MCIAARIRKTVEYNMYRKTSTRPAFEEEPPSDEDMIQKSLEGSSRRPSNLSRRRSRFGEGDEGVFAGRLNKSRLTDQNEYSSPLLNKGGSPEFQEESPDAEYAPMDDREQGEFDQADEIEADEAPPTTEGFGPDAQNTKYFGFSKGGQKHGMGLLVHRDFEYEGQFKEDQYCGLGRLRTLDFEYEGAFENSLPQGAGLLVKDTGIYKGKFEGGFDPEGLGEIQIPGGAVYRGMISAARLHGFGTLTDSKGKIYTGYWKDGLKEGSGREKTKAGEYVGSWSKGKRHGAGAYTAADWKYEGDWRNGKREGVGLYKEGPITYLGTFEADLRNGLGKLIDSRSKTSYFGGFLHDMKQGIGFLVVSNEESFFGEWNEDKKHGLGVLVRGKVETKGTWVDDDLHGYAYVTQPGKPAKVEVYSRGRLVQNPARKPTKEDIDELLAQISETLPPTFFSIVSTKLNSLVVKEPVMYKLGVVRETEKSLKEIDAAVENSRIACQKDRKDLQTWLLKRGVNTSIDAGKTWDLEDIQQKRSKRESEAEMKSTFESQAEEGDRQNQTTQNASRINSSRIGNKKNNRNVSRTEGIKKIEEEDDPDASPVIIRTARRNGRMDNPEELDEMVRRRARPDETRKQAITKRDQEARIAEVEADFQKYLKEKDAGNVPEVDSDDNSNKAPEERPGQTDLDVGLGIGRKYQSSTQHIDEPDFNTEEFSAYRQSSPKGASKDRLSNLGKQEYLNDSISRGNTDIRKTSLDVPGGEDNKDPQVEPGVYQHDSNPQMDKTSSMLDIQSGRNDLSRSGKSRKVYSVPKSDFDIDNNDAVGGDETKNQVEPSTAKFDESQTSRAMADGDSPQRGYDQILTEEKKPEIKIEDGYEPPANSYTSSKMPTHKVDEPEPIPAQKAEPGIPEPADPDPVLPTKAPEEVVPSNTDASNSQQINSEFPASDNPISRKSSQPSYNPASSDIKPEANKDNNSNPVVDPEVHIQTQSRKESAADKQPETKPNADQPSPPMKPEVPAPIQHEEISDSASKPSDLKTPADPIPVNPTNNTTSEDPPAKIPIQQDEPSIVPPPPLPAVTKPAAEPEVKHDTPKPNDKPASVPENQERQPQTGEDLPPQVPIVDPVENPSEVTPKKQADDNSPLEAPKPADQTPKADPAEASPNTLPPPPPLLPAEQDATGPQSTPIPAPPILTPDPTPTEATPTQPTTSITPTTEARQDQTPAPPLQPPPATPATPAATPNAATPAPQPSQTAPEPPVSTDPSAVTPPTKDPQTPADNTTTTTTTTTETGESTTAAPTTSEQTADTHRSAESGQETGKDRQTDPAEGAKTLAQAEDAKGVKEEDKKEDQPVQKTEEPQGEKKEEKIEEKKEEPKKEEQLEEKKEDKPEEKKEEKKDDKKDWRSKLPGSIDELKSQGVGGLLNTGKGMFGF